MYITYIIHSKELQRYYVGYTGEELQERIRKHNSNHKGFTGKTNDWSLVFKQEFTLKKEALTLENKIKKRGAKRFLYDLKNDSTG
jgi:putative endonuclease